ncbi:unnamed protein product [Mortierella alpina]
MASRRGTAPPSPCPAPSFLLNPPPSPWVSAGRSGPSNTNAARASASAISSSSRLEREHYLRQNRDISRLCSLKSAQIRQFEAKLSSLERENLGMRIALREAENGLRAWSGARAASSSSSSSTSANFSDLQDVDMLGEAEVIVPRPSQEREANDADLLEETDGHEGAEDDCSDNNEDVHRRKRRKLSRRASPFGPKTFLLSKLDQVQVIYQREHQALCTMMASFNSTSRFYRDLLQQLEEHALSTRKGTGIEFSDDHSLEPRGPSPQHSQHHEQQESNPTDEMPQTSHDSPQKTQRCDQSSESASRVILKHSPRQSSSSASPSPFFEPKRYLRRRTRQPKVHQKPRSPRTRSTKSLVSSVKPSGPTAETTLPPSEKATRDLDDSEDSQIIVTRAPRPSGATRNALSMNALPGIAEDGPLELSGAISGTGDSFTFLQSRLSVSTEYLGSTVPPDVTTGGPESDRSDQSNVQDSIARKLKPRQSSPDIQTAKHKEEGLYKHRTEKTRRIGDSCATQDSGSERAKSIALSKALLAKFSKPAAPSHGSGNMSAPEQPQVASLKVAHSTNTRDLDNCGAITDANSGLQDGDADALQGADTLWEALSNGDNTSKGGAATASPRRSGVSRRPIVARRRGFLRATPSPLVKSRSAIKAQHLKVMTPAQLLRRMNKTLLGTPKAPALPTSITRNAAYSGLYSTSTPSVSSGPLPSTQAGSVSLDSAQNEQFSGSDGSTLAAKQQMPPPPTLATNSSKKHRTKVATTAGTAIKMSGSSPVDGTGEKESMSVSNAYDGQEVTEQADVRQDLQDTSSRSSSKRMGAPTVAYRLPSLRE